MQSISNIDVFKKIPSKKEISVEQPRDGYCTIEDIKSMLSAFQRHKPFFMCRVKTEDEFNLIAKEWFYMLKDYRQTDRKQVVMMFLESTDDNVILGEFLTTIKSVAHRNALSIEQKHREQQVISITPTSKERAKKYLDEIRKCSKSFTPSYLNKSKVKESNVTEIEG